MLGSVTYSFAGRIPLLGETERMNKRAVRDAKEVMSAAVGSVRRRKVSIWVTWAGHCGDGQE